MEKTRHVAAASHTGKIRSNNQDSGYAGTHLFMVADGMGGHAGGDTASAIAVKRVAEADRSYATSQEAAASLQSALLAANTQLEETVAEHPELAGMGTTVSALIRSGDDVVAAHIGDSRIYLFRNGELRQVTNDHTFVQRLVDSGRITEDEARVHPRRSVLMRVLGDVDAAPEVDVQVLHTQPGDRWLLCSDGLSGFVSHDEILAAMMRREHADTTAQHLIRLSLEHGAPDNVTVVVLEIDDQELPDAEPLFVGSAAGPMTFAAQPAGARSRHPLQRRTQARHSHFERASQDFLDELIEEDERRAGRRTLLRRMAIGVVIVLAIAGLFLAWSQLASPRAGYAGTVSGTETITPTCLGVTNVG